MTGDGNTLRIECEERNGRLKDKNSFLNDSRGIRINGVYWKE
jgi:hypothetical protein